MVLAILLGLVAARHADRLSPSFKAKLKDDKCKAGACAGVTYYPVDPGNEWYAEFDVPRLPAKIDDITHFIYFNIFFRDSKPHGKMNQFVPQLMLGEPLCGSTGPPLYKPKWEHHTTWIFGSQYFFEIFNV